jgi:hypothetical protein
MIFPYYRDGGVTVPRHTILSSTYHHGHEDSTSFTMLPLQQLPYQSTSLHTLSPFTGYPFLPVQDTLYQGTDPTSPELFKQNLQLAQEHVARLQDLARNALVGM